MADPPQYSRKLDEAVQLAMDGFRTKIRKGTGVPYLTHLLQVMVTVGEAGGDEEQMIAAVLHDYLEDVPGATAGELGERFGERVASMVVALSDSTTHPKPPWEGRKQTYLAHLKDEAPQVKLVSTADKLHNAESILRDYQTVGEALWDRFTASREDTHWYYRAVVVALRNNFNHPLVDRLDAAVREIHERTGVAFRDEALL